MGKLLLDFVGRDEVLRRDCIRLVTNRAETRASFWDPARCLLQSAVGRLGLALAAVCGSAEASKICKFLFAYLLSVLVLYGATFFLGLGDIAVNRGILFASVALAGLPIMMCASRWERHLNRGLKRKLLLFTLIIVLIVPQFVFAHDLPLARYERVGSMDATMRFVFDHRDNRSIAAIGDVPIYYCFYEPTFTDYRILWRSEWQSLSEVNSFFANNTDSLKVIDYKNIIDWGAILRHDGSYQQALREWDTEVSAKIDGQYVRVYSSGYKAICL